MKCSSNKFDYIISNPPYQASPKNDVNNYAQPIYHKFLYESYKLSDRVLMITPAKFLFDAGGTPKKWNLEMLNDPHLKIELYQPNSYLIFPGVDLNGGVAITYHDNTKRFVPIGTFIPQPEMNSIVCKVKTAHNFYPQSRSVFPVTLYRFTKKMYEDHPECIGRAPKGHEMNFSSIIFERFPEIFYDEPPNDGNEYAKVLGRIGGKSNGYRLCKYIRRDYFNDVRNHNYYKVIVARAYGDCTFGEKISPIEIGEPGTAHTESFISIGKFDTREEAVNLRKYLHTRFARALINVFKVTHNVSQKYFRYVPEQNFTDHSSLKWDGTIDAIDWQLFKKYNLDDKEIEFLYNNVKGQEIKDE